MTHPLALRLWPAHAAGVAAVLTATGLGVWQYDAWQARRDDAAVDLTREAPRPLPEVMGSDDPFPGADVGRPVEVSTDDVTSSPGMNFASQALWIDSGGRHFASFGAVHFHAAEQRARGHVPVDVDGAGNPADQPVGVNVLAADQSDLASHFARSGGEKFAGIPWVPGIGESPMLTGVAAVFECTKHSMIETGDHFIVLGKVERFARYERPLLLFANGRFGLAVDFPAAPKESGHPGPDEENRETMLGLLWDAFSKMSKGFQAERDAEGLSINQGRILSIIERHPAAKTAAISRKACCAWATAIP